MGRLYTVEFSGGSILNADGDIDWFEITPGDDRPVAVHGLFMSQTSDLGDAEEEILQWQVIRGHTTTGSGGLAPTIEAVVANDAAATFTTEGLNDTVATSGTVDNGPVVGWNVRIPLEFWWSPETRPTASQANTLLVIRQLAAATDDLTGVAGTLYVEELI